jgi:hypothetical protein
MFSLYIHEGYGIYRLVSMTTSAKLTLTRVQGYRECGEVVKLMIW